jgi:predicted acylesterase/phospholipase RssA
MYLSIFFIIIMSSSFINSIKLPMIKHIVISGGGAAGFSYYGVLKQTQNRGLWYPENINTIYATSAGTFLAVILALGYDWNIIDDYLIKRPWHKVYKFELSMAIKTVLNQGMFDNNSIYETFKPLFKGKDIPIDINLLDFYKCTNKELHFFTTDYNSFNTIDISYKTHPEWKVLDAIYASSSLPILFIPFYKIEEEVTNIYVDGGIKMNFPLNKCIDDGNNPNEILGINRIDLNNHHNGKELSRSDNLFEFICKIIYKYTEQIVEPSVKINISHKIGVAFSALDFTALYRCVSNSDERKQLIDQGIQIADIYVDNFIKENETEI